MSGKIHPLLIVAAAFFLGLVIMCSAVQCGAQRGRQQYRQNLDWKIKRALGG